MVYTGINWYRPGLGADQGIMQLDKQHPTPIYLQLKELLRSQIEQGLYISHQKLPSERDLCQHYNLSRMTARRALQELIDEGLAYTRVGKGTYVSHQSNNTITAANNLNQSPHLNLSPNITFRYQQKLVDELSSFNCVEAEQTINDAVAAYSVEQVAMNLFPEVIRQLEQQWQQGKISLLGQNYAFTTLRSHLIAMFNAAATLQLGKRVVLACAPQDQHEIGLLLLALSLRRRGFRVIYLGPNVSATDFHQLIDTALPDLICFSAAIPEAGKALVTLSQQCLTNLKIQSTGNVNPLSTGPVFTFGGAAFTQRPSLVAQVQGLYLGDTVDAAVTKIQRLFSQ